MQFVRGGPDIPEDLLRDHEAGRVVFFCGAGVSRNAGLPDFQELAEQLVDKFGDADLKREVRERESKPSDIIQRLERDTTGGAVEVRKALLAILACKKESTIHQDLLRLSHDPTDRATRLVTTNFDRLFESALQTTGGDIYRFRTPHLPQASQRWDGIVYLHGLLEDEQKEADLKNLVLTNADFGRNYLVQGAAHFVSDLIRSYTVCIVGYSIEDPEIRFIVDYLSEANYEDVRKPIIYTFAPHSEDLEEECMNIWKSKNVTPILYVEGENHEPLTETLHEWARIHAEGIEGKQQVVRDCLDYGRGEEFIARRLQWAVSDPSGKPALVFAQNDPTPSLEWLDLLEGSCLHIGDLIRKRVAPQTEWSEVTHRLADWLLRYIGDHRLLYRLLAEGDRLHPIFARMIKRFLDNLNEKERGTKYYQPVITPNKALITLWRLLLVGQIQVAPQYGRHSLHDWHDTFQHEGLTTASRFYLRSLLTPRLLPNVYSQEHVAQPADTSSISDIAHVSIVLATVSETTSIHTVLNADFLSSKKWRKVLPHLFVDFNSLLHDAVHLAKEGDINLDEISYYALPSICPHPQNEKPGSRHDWAILIELARDAWLAMLERDPKAATQEAQNWAAEDNVVFRRLALFAATYSKAVSNENAVEWLLSDNRYWLWSSSTKREAIRLLIALAPRLSGELSQRIVGAILEGIPEKEKKNPIIAFPRKDNEHEKWFRLVKYASAGGSLTEVGEQNLAELNEQHPEWTTENDESDEFAVFFEGARMLERNVTDFSPTKLESLIQWLEEHPSPPPWHEESDDDWKERCRDDLVNTAAALCSFKTKEGWQLVLPRWYQALSVWSELSEEAQRREIWERLYEVLCYSSASPDELLQSIELSRWLHKVAGTLTIAEEKDMFALAKRIFDATERRPSEERFSSRDDITECPVTASINHPIGITTEVLLSRWYATHPKRNSELKGNFRSLFTKVCDAESDYFRHGLCVLARSAFALFHVDSDWCEHHLLSRFHWEHSKGDAKTVWCGLITTQSIYLDSPLLTEIRDEFLRTATYYDSLVEQKAIIDYGKHYAGWLTFMALEKTDIFSNKQLRQVLEQLPVEGRCRNCVEVRRSIACRGQQGRVFEEQGFSLSSRMCGRLGKSMLAPRLPDVFARLSILAGKHFPQAFEEVSQWMQTLPEHSCNLLGYLILDEGHCEEFAETVVKLLCKVVPDDEDQYSLYNVSDCIKQIFQKQPEILKGTKLESLL